MPTEPEAAATETAALSSKEPAAPAPSKRRVLVVEDNPDSADTLARLLSLLGSEVYTASTGPEGLALADQVVPELILLDIGLPGMDGFEVARRLRAQERFNDVVVVALTGYGSAADRRRSQEAGFDAHLVKPVELDALQELLAHPEVLRWQRNP